LGGARGADRQTACPDHRRAGAQTAAVRGADDQRRHRAGVARDVGCNDGPAGRGSGEVDAAGPLAHQTGSLLKDQIPIRTWAQWDDAVPGFVEIDLVGHEGGNAIGEHAYTLTVTDIATGWTENRSVRNKAVTA